MEGYNPKTLFEICALCDGTGVLPDDLMGMGQCVCAGKGFISSGLTLTQFDHYKVRMEEAEAKIARNGVCPRCDHDSLTGGSAGKDDRQVFASCPSCGWSAIVA
jgi:hypothetical protein